MVVEELNGKRLGVLGLGVNNVGLVEWLLRHKLGEVTVCDQNPALRLDHPNWEGKVKWRLGPDYLKRLTDFDMVFRTPGIPYLSNPIQEAKAAGVTISSQTKLFFDLSPAKIIGVTGTKGKGTTASLIAALLTAHAKKQIHHTFETYLAGNIGEDPFVFFDQLTIHDWVVLELSSFQLQDMEKSPHIAVALTIGSDHLDHHRDVREYTEAKSQIVRHQKATDYAILHVDSPASFRFASLTEAAVWYYSRRVSVDQGAYIRWQEGQTPRNGTIMLRTDRGEEIALGETTSLKLRGEHNLENVTAAVTAAYVAGVSASIIKQGIPQFQGLPHRLEPVGEWQGRFFYNDSFATNPEPVMAAVQSFQAPIHLIVGGSTKHADFGELARVIREGSTVKTVIPLGKTEGPRIAQAITAQTTGTAPMITEPTKSMPEAVERAVRASERGDIILLSPGAASFDLFPNYKKRGDAFRRAVQKLAK